MQKQTLPPIPILFILISVASVAAVIFTPALPEIKKYFHLAPDQVHWTMRLFLFAFAFGQLLYAPFSNRFNRKNTLFSGLSLACIGTLLCIASYHFHSYALLLFGLLVTALGSSVCLSLTYTIINDVYSLDESRKIIPMATLSFPIMPGLGLFTGSILVDLFSWQACFVFILFYFLFVMLLVYLLPETSNGSDLNALNIKNLYNTYKKTFKSGHLWFFSFIWGCCTSIVYIFVTLAPLIVIEQMHVEPHIYGLFTLITSTGFVLGTVASRLMVSLLNRLQMITTGALIALTGNLLLILLSIDSDSPPVIIFLCMFLVFFGLPSIFTSAASIATTGLKDKATASAVMTFINMGTTVVFLTLVSGLPGEAINKLMASILALLLLLLFLAVGTRFKDKWFFST